MEKYKKKKLFLTGLSKMTMTASSVKTKCIQPLNKNDTNDKNESNKDVNSERPLMPILTRLTTWPLENTKRQC